MVTRADAGDEDAHVAVRIAEFADDDLSFLKLHFDFGRGFVGEEERLQFT